MKVAYREEIESSKKTLEATKLELESWYANRYTDEQVIGDASLKEQHDTLVLHADNVLHQYQGTSKNIRSACVPHPI